MLRFGSPEICTNLTGSRSGISTATDKRRLHLSLAAGSMRFSTTSARTSAAAPASPLDAPLSSATRTGTNLHMGAIRRNISGFTCPSSVRTQWHYRILESCPVRSTLHLGQVLDLLQANRLSMSTQRIVLGSCAMNTFSHRAQRIHDLWDRHLSLATRPISIQDT